MIDPKCDGVAVFIDADNVPAKYIGSLEEILRRLGTPVYSCAYGTPGALSGWESVCRNRHIQAKVVFCSAKGGNAADMRLVDDMADLRHNPSFIISRMAVVSSDNDYAHIVMLHREKGDIVYGIGTAGADSRLAIACNRYFTLQEPVSPEVEEVKPASSATFTASPVSGVSAAPSPAKKTARPAAAAGGLSADDIRKMKCLKNRPGRKSAMMNVLMNGGDCTRAEAEKIISLSIGYGIITSNSGNDKIIWRK